MNKRRFGLIATAMGMAGLMGSAQAATSATAKLTEQVNELKGTKEERKSKEAININQDGGLDFNPFLFNDAGLSPKEYGLRFGTGKSFICKSNRKRFATNAKLKRRRIK
ncbi:hypothetical protein [Pedobacter punctiformis]|uniref:Uncharacterized protein n=1 Tax=Pedobacter punctiformis TaxID=3004097 RepID=A0ABT4LAM2_9SPHI|nr:hypothetical protein [Pedobacter sp. HCMS5-2]MCZ4244954.1 hypothetical protein [Pedobacter sp. HCMS5-2]